jgi:hypothetical protein
LLVRRIDIKAAALNPLSRSMALTGSHHGAYHRSAYTNTSAIFEMYQFSDVSGA